VFILASKAEGKQSQENITFKSEHRIRGQPTGDLSTTIAKSARFAGPATL